MGMVCHYILTSMSIHPDSGYKKDSSVSALKNTWMDVDYVKVYTNNIYIGYPNSLCFSAFGDAQQYTLSNFPGCSYDWGNDSSSTAFSFFY